MTTSSRRASLGTRVAFALCLAVLVPASAAAQQQQAPHQPTAQELETARSLYKEGKELRAAGDLSGAIEKLRAAHALGNTPVTGIELARALEAGGRLIDAREVALSIAHIPVAGDETQKSAEARIDAVKLADDLRARIPTLRARVTGLAPGEPAHLAIDGVAVPDAALAEPQKVDPGKHVLLLHVGEGASARDVRAEVSAVEGRSAEVLLEVPPAPATPQPAPPPPVAPTQQAAPPLQAAPAPAAAPAHHSSTLAKAGFAVAAVGAVSGAITGFMALTKKGELPNECPNQQCAKGTQAASDLDSARTSATMSTVAFSIAGAGLVLGIVALVTDHPSTPSTGARVSPWVGLGAAGVHGSF